MLVPQTAIIHYLYVKKEYFDLEGNFQNTATISLIVSKLSLIQIEPVYCQ
jgi:hypothetical protein